MQPTPELVLTAGARPEQSPLFSTVAVLSLRGAGVYGNQINLFLLHNYYYLYEKYIRAGVTSGAFVFLAVRIFRIFWS